MTKFARLWNGGSIAGSLAFLYFLILYFGMGAEFVLVPFEEEILRESMTIRIHPFGGVKMFGVVIPIVLMYRAMKAYREEESEGFIAYGEAFRTGVLFSFVYASLSAMLIYLFGAFLDSSFVDFANASDMRVLSLVKEQGQDLFGSLDEQIELIEKRSVVDFALSDLWTKSTSGIIIALILAAVLKKNPPTFAQDE
jgi:hypothetical protein